MTVRWPAAQPVRSLAGPHGRLVIPGYSRRETLAEYTARGGYAAGHTGGGLIDEVEGAGLLGRGGAAFPAGRKLRSVAERPGPRYVVANGDEGEPLSVKDRWLMRIRPHLVLDGLFRAAQAIAAAKAYVYLSDALAAASISEAIGELGAVPLPVETVLVTPSYVGGEETAVVRAINGGPALPTDKPPRPFEAGIDGQPTLVANVETLANLPAIATLGGQAFLDSSLDPAAAGTFLLTLSGACRRPGLYEVRLGSSLADVASETGRFTTEGGEFTAGTGGFTEETGEFTAEPRGALMGGFFGGIVGPRILSLPLSYPALRAEGTGLGCGAIRVLGDDDCPVRAAADVMDYFAANNARQCGPCIRGTSAMSQVVGALAAGTAGPGELAKLEGWSVSLRRRGACAHLDGAAQVAATLLREFPADVAKHATAQCPVCAGGQPDPFRRLEVVLE
jgi:NADH:ubiquinone oxidoreductase subunit F (NADH-binding)